MIKSPKYLRDGRSPIPKKETTSRVMSANQGKHTLPEINLRKNLRQINLRDYSLHVPKLAGRPDIVFKKKNLAVFVNGCFWHRCPYCKQSMPKTHSAFWRNKFKNNTARDKRNIALLKKEGWRVFVAWECQLKNDS